MSQQRGINRVVNVPPAAPGFVGPGHLAAPVVSPENFEMTDPFILLMDDHLDIGNRPVGGPHPHAGFETVTLILDGAIFDRDEGGTLNAGEVQWMTAGSGIIHSEDVRTKGKVRLLQLWLTLPKNNRSTDVGTSVLRVDAGESGARLVLYAGQPQGDPIVSYGPFIGDSKQDIARLFAEYQSGRFPRLSELKKQQV